MSIDRYTLLLATYLENETQDFEITIKKYWVAYAISSFLILIGLCMVNASSFIRYIGYALVLYNAIWIYSISTVQWRFSQSELNITSGIFPWTKNVWQVPVLDIYESTVSFGMFGHVLGYGNIKIRTIEGAYPVIYGSTLLGAKEFSGQINELVHKNDEQMKCSCKSTDERISDELRIYDGHP